MSFTTALLIIAHGSPTPGANDAMMQIIEDINRRRLFDCVQEGYLECNDPDIGAAIEICVSRGIRRITVAPYFLHVGKHVAGDLPRILAQAQEKHPDIEISLGAHIGCSPAISDILADRSSTIIEMEPVR